MEQGRVALFLGCHRDPAVQTFLKHDRIFKTFCRIMQKSRKIGFIKILPIPHCKRLTGKFYAERVLVPVRIEFFL